jgi:4-hydroxyphenylpyruvate dioxygenase
VRRARAAGVPLLEIPANYYDDLEARLGVDTTELRDLGLLYDRDERGGELRHAFTAARGRVFFELVERRGGYAGYGTANTPVRMAAQRN